MSADRAGKFDAGRAAREVVTAILSEWRITDGRHDATEPDERIEKALREAFAAGVMAASDALAKREKEHVAYQDGSGTFEDRASEVAWCGVVVRELLEKGRGE